MVEQFCYSSTHHILDEDTFTATLATLPNPRAERILSTSHQGVRYLRLASEVALRDALEKIGEDYASLTISYTDLGKPYVEGRPDLAISQSHRGLLGCAFCVRSLDGAPVFCGVDVEQLTPLTEHHVRLKNRFLPPKTPMDEVGFFMAWTKMEALVKLTGVGMSGALEAQNTPCVTLSHLHLMDAEHAGYVVCLARKKGG